MLTASKRLVLQRFHLVTASLKVVHYVSKHIYPFSTDKRIRIVRTLCLNCFLYRVTCISRLPRQSDHSLSLELIAFHSNNMTRATFIWYNLTLLKHLSRISCRPRLIMECIWRKIGSIRKLCVAAPRRILITYLCTKNIEYRHSQVIKHPNWSEKLSIGSVSTDEF